MTMNQYESVFRVFTGRPSVHSDWSILVDPQRWTTFLLDFLGPLGYGDDASELSQAKT